MPINSPALGLIASPLPMKIRMKSANGSAVAEALGDFSVSGAAGSPVVVAEAAPGSWLVRPSSRRVNAAAVHINGVATGASSPLPVCSQASSPRPIPSTEPLVVVARGAAIITGVWAAAGAMTVVSIAGVDAECSETDGIGVAIGSNDGTEVLAEGRGVDDCPGGSGVDDGGSAWTAGSFTGALVSCGISESPRLRRVGAEVSGPPEPRTVGAVGAVGAVGESSVGSPAVGVSPGTSVEGRCDPVAGTSSQTAVSAVGASASVPAESDGVDGAGDSTAESLRALVFASGRDVDALDEVSEFGPVDPSEPLVSAKAAGIVTMADPTPRAMAKDPTRPT